MFKIREYVLQQGIYYKGICIIVYVCREYVLREYENNIFEELEKKR